MQISSTNWVGTNVWATDEDLEDQIVLPGHTHNGTNSPKVAWGSIDAKPSTFPATIGNGAADAVAGNDSRLEASFLTVVAGEALGAYKLVYLDPDNAGKAYLATNTGLPIQANTMGLTEGTINSAASGSIRVKPGVVENPLWSWTPGTPLYLATAGNITETAPVGGEGVVLRPVGYAISVTQMYFAPRDGVIDPSFSINADILSMNFIPDNYTPAVEAGVTSDTDQLSSHLKGIDDKLVSLTWDDLDFTSSDLADLTTKSHTSLSDIGTTTHANIDSHIADATKHRQINDAGSGATDLWSASKIASAISASVTSVLSFEDAVLDKDLSVPPLTPTDGDRYIIKATGTGDWAGHDNDIADYTTDHWVFTDATSGLSTWVTDEGMLYIFSGTSWLPMDNLIYASVAPPAVDYNASDVGDSTDIARADHTHSLASHDHSASEVNLQVNGTPTYSTLDDLANLGSAGRISGGDITDDTLGGVVVSAVQGMIRTTESDTGELVFFDIAETLILSASLTDNALNYIIVDYNGGSPRVTSTTNRAGILINTQFILGRLFKSGTDVEIFVGGVNLVNSHRNNHDRLIMRGVERMRGAIVTETGTRNLAISDGILYFGSNKITTAAQDTSTTGEIERTYYRKALSGWNEIDELTQIDNIHYDDGSGTLATLDDGAYGVHWIYVCLKGDLYSVYGQGSYTLGQAQAAQEPETLPTYITSFAILTAKIIIQKGATSFNTIVSGYTSTLATIALSDHTGLSGLQGGASGEYYHLTSNDYTALTSSRQETISDGVNSLILAGAHTGITWTYDDPNNAGSLAVQYGTTGTTACVGNDSRLASTPTTWNPLLSWTSAPPADITSSARYMQVGKLVTFWFSLSGSDGDGQTLTSISMPVTPANTSMETRVSARRLIDTTNADPFAYVDTTQAVAGNRTLKFHVSSAFTNNRAYALQITGTYEAA